MHYKIARPSPIYGSTNPPPQEAQAAPVKYYAAMVELKPDMEEKYRELHANIWPEVRAAIHRANIRHFQIHVVGLAGKRYLISHFEYIGTDPATDFGGMADDPTTRDHWWPLTDACQIRLPGTPDGEHWLPLESVMHLD